MKKNRIFFSIVIFIVCISSHFALAFYDGSNDGCQSEVADNGEVTGSCGFSTFVLMQTRLDTSPWCIINNNESMDVVFDAVDPNKISSGKYKKSLQYEFICSDATPGYNVFFKLEGNKAAGFDDEKTIETSINGLGMQILMDGAPMTIHEKKMVNLASPPQLEVILVKQLTKTLEGDDFSGSASMTVVYD
ncbi:hypothetical protein ACTUSR_07255 [Pantoea stewartii subsp. indologenes]|uniref:hypothetical protein n=1 Tax=Pantoea stewartii TaxID=66269 RepID=UPI003FA4BFA4